MAKVVELQGEKFKYEGVLNKDPSVLIDWFDDLGTHNPICWLSNFYVGSPFMWAGYEWQTSEHAYQAAKYFNSNDEQFLKILNAPTPADAKFLGRTGTNIRADWESAKYAVMKDVVWAKFSSHDDLAQLLLDTGDAYLQEGTFWNDEVWGVNLVQTNPDGSHSIIEDPFARPGRNWLGTILMEVRARLLAEMVWDTSFQEARFAELVDSILTEEEED